MSYKRGIENTQRGIYTGEGTWDIPKLDSVDSLDIVSWQHSSGGVCVGYNYCKSLLKKMNVDCKEIGVHFFLDDYQFERLWQRPGEYVSTLSEFKFVLSPDFSLYTDHPKAVQLWNHYKKHWLGRYWEQNGLTVIPTICWSDSKSFEWCFDGEPKNSIVAISTKGTQGDELAKERFYAGYYQMLRRLEPTAVMLFGKNPGALDGNVIEMGYEFDDCMGRRK
jgi:hypothetical protein